MLCSLWENKDVVCFVSQVARVEAVYWPPSPCPAAHCWGQEQATQAPYNLCVLLIPASRSHVKKKGVQSIGITLRCFLAHFKAGRESHTEAPLLLPLLAGVDGSTDVWLEGKALHNQATKQQRQSHRKQTRGVCQMQISRFGWGSGGSFESLWSSLCSDQRAGYLLFPPFGTIYEIKPPAGGQNTASISQEYFWHAIDDGWVP